MRPKKVKKEVKKSIKSSIKVLTETYFAEGKTISEAILNLKPKVYKALGILTLEKGVNKKEKIIYPAQMYRLFGSGSQLTKEIALKQVTTLFDKSLFE